MLKKERKPFILNMKIDFKFNFFKMRQLKIKIERDFIEDCFKLNMNNDFELSLSLIHI